MIEIVQGVVLRCEDSGESDKRLALYTRELGKIKAKVTGVKKPRSKLSGLTFPFSEYRFQIYLHGTKRAGLRDPGKIIGGETIEFHLPLRSDWKRMVQAAAWCEILDSLTHPFYPNPKEYELLRSTLNQIETSPLPLLARLRSTLILLKILGYSLIHHSIWKSYSDTEKSLLKHLAKWNGEEEEFSKSEIEKLETLTNSYLSLYLPHPLKTELFQKKLLETTDQTSAPS